MSCHVADAFAVLERALSEKIAKTQRGGADAFGSGDIASVEQHLEAWRELSALRAALGQIQLALNPAHTIAAEEATSVEVPASAPEATESVSETVALPEPVSTPTPPNQEPVPTIAETVRELIPKVKPARPKPPKATQSERRFQEDVSRLHKLAAETDSTSSIWRTRQMACLAREAMLQAKNLDRQYPALHQDFDRALELHNVATHGSTFFAFNLSRELRPEAWHDLASAFGCLDVAQKTLVHLQGLEELDAEMLELLDLVAAAESWTHRLLKAERPDINDSLLARMHQAVMERKPESYVVRSWKMPENGGPPTDEVARDAKRLADRFEEMVSRRTKKQARDAAHAELRAFLVDPDTSDAFEAKLGALVEACLDAGWAPSSNDLRIPLAGYRLALQEAANPKLAKLIEHIRRDENQHLARHQTVADAEEPVDADFERKVAELRSYVEGKTLLLVGGNKGQRFRIKNLEQVLGLKKLNWPDAEDDTHIDRLKTHVRSADIVAQLIRWCRHSYALVLAEAKNQGKPCARLPGGLGVHRIVHDLHLQLVPNKH